MNPKMKRRLFEKRKKLANVLSLKLVLIVLEIENHFNHDKIIWRKITYMQWLTCTLVHTLHDILEIAKPSAMAISCTYIVSQVYNILHLLPTHVNLE